MNKKHLQRILLVVGLSLLMVNVAFAQNPFPPPPMPPMPPPMPQIPDLPPLPPQPPLPPIPDLPPQPPILPMPDLPPQPPDINLPPAVGIPGSGVNDLPGNMPPINQNPDQSWLHTYQLQMLFEQSALAPLRGGIEAQQEFMIDMILMGEAVTSAANMRCGPASLCRPSLTDIVGDAFLFAWERTNPLELARQELAQMGYQEASQYQNLQMEHERIVAAVSAAAGNDVNYIAAVEAEQRAFLRRQEALTQQRQAELVRELASNDAVAQSWEQFYRQVEQRIRDELNANQVRLINDEFRSLDNESDRLNRLLN